MAQLETIRFDIENGVAWIRLNRPEARNAVNAPMREEFLAALLEARGDTAVRAVVLTGEGKAFCAGADLAGARGSSPASPGAIRDAMRQSSQRLIRALWELEKPTLAAVHGVAAGLGAHLAFACDLVIAAEEARFIEVFVRRGLAVDAGGAFLLPRLIGLQKAKELVFFGEDVTADEAHRIGLVNRVVPLASMLAAAREWAERLAAGPTFALGLSKRLLNRSLESSLETCLEEEALAQALVAQSEDMREGMLAFAEKRAPRFVGR